MSTKEDLIQGLNEDLAAEYGTIIRYTYQSGKAFGLLGAELPELLATELRNSRRIGRQIGLCRAEVKAGRDGC